MVSSGLPSKAWASGLFPNSFEGVTLSSHIFGYPLRPFGTAKSVEYLSDDSTRQIDDEQGLNSGPAHTSPNYVEQNPSSLADPSTHFTVPLESDWIPSVLVEAADAERRERLRQILMGVRVASKESAA